MKLNQALHQRWGEAKSAAGTIAEGPLPRWQFQYDRSRHDPSPDVLVLGTHDSETGNPLVGGINLNYLDDRQLRDLRGGVEQVARGGDLQQRYRIGRRVLPDIFNNFYRTYNTQAIRAVQPGELDSWQPPRKPVTPPQQQPQAAPQTQAPQRQPRPTPGPKVQSTPPGADLPGLRPAPESPAGDDFYDEPRDDRRELSQIAKAYKQKAAQIQAASAKKAEADATMQAQTNLQRERQKNLEQLVQPSEHPEPDPLAAESNTIRYWSQVEKRYIEESIR